MCVLFTLLLICYNNNYRPQKRNNPDNETGSNSNEVCTPVCTTVSAHWSLYIHNGLKLVIYLTINDAFF